MSPDTGALLEPLRALAADAGRQILAIYGSDFAVDTKPDHSPVTAADRLAHIAISTGLQRLTPGIPVWSEESGEIAFGVRAGWREFWLVDPLDGTREFIKRNGEFTVNIALVRDHEPVLGIVHVPLREEDYFGVRGHGAFRSRGGAVPQAVTVSRSAADPIRVAGSRSHAGTSLETFLKRLGPHQLITLGSSLKFCLVAAGEADVYPRLGPTWEWDTAAGQAVVESAGGQVVGVDGRPLRYNTRADARNPWFLAFGDASRNWRSYVDGNPAR